MKIDIIPSWCRVNGTQEELLWIKELLTFDIPGARYMTLYKQGRWDGRKRIFNSIARVFPVGLLNYVLKHKKDRIITMEDYRDFKKIDMLPVKLNTIVLRDYQQQAIKTCLEKKNCLIEAATNSGKTAIFSGLIKKLYPIPTLILTHREELLKQTVDFIERYTGLECGVITAKDVLIKPVTVAMITTLLNRIGVDQEISDFYESIHCVITDEVHHSLASSYVKILSPCKAIYRFGFSGTIPPEDTIDGVMVRQFIGDVGFRVTNDELIEMGISARPKIFLYEIDMYEKVKDVFSKAREVVDNEMAETKELFLTNKIEKKVYDKIVMKLSSPRYYMKKVYDFVIKDGLINNEDRNIKSVEIIQKDKSKSTLIVVDYLEHGYIVEQLLKNNGIVASFISGESSNRTKDLQNFKKGKLKVLVSTSIIDEGLDVPIIERLVLLAGKKSRRQLLQRIGRSLRHKEGENTVEIHDFCDYGNKYLMHHTRERLRIYKEEKFSIQFM